MSQKNREGKSTARERLLEDRRREKAAERRLRVAKVLGVALAVLGVAAVVGYIAAGQGGNGDADGPADPIAVGSARAPATLSIYEDFRCPACAQFEISFRDTIGELTEEGKLRTEYHLVTIIDGNLGGDGSQFAANAAACARDEGAFTEYHDVLYDNQPPESADAFGDKDRLIDLAAGIEELDTESFRSCVRDGTHDDWVERSNNAFRQSSYQATPTVLLNGENIYGDPSDPLTPQRLRERVDELAGEEG
ncbi:thioredoxin domain-containing protein [Streptomyces sodiiphilus]|uniref:Thioredoxin domain-containing protein n=1 Tax=Streptomyces sodiiphilus TaxID=226217 RepID=A0ABP5AVC4_9ACTN